MRNTITHLILIGSFGLIGCSNANKPTGKDAGISEAEKTRRAEEERAKERVRNIERVLAADNGASVGLKSVAEAVSRLRAISLAGCPTEFSSAYLAHIHAWEDMAIVERDFIAFNEDYNSNGAIFEAIVRGLMLDPLGKAKEANAEERRLKANYQVANTKIKETFHRVEEIAVAAGATLPIKK